MGKSWLAMAVSLTKMAVTTTDRWLIPMKMDELNWHLHKGFKLKKYWPVICVYSLFVSPILPLLLATNTDLFEFKLGRDTKKPTERYEIPGVSIILPSYQRVRQWLDLQYSFWSYSSQFPSCNVTKQIEKTLMQINPSFSNVLKSLSLFVAPMLQRSFHS